MNDTECNRTSRTLLGCSLLTAGLMVLLILIFVVASYFFEADYVKYREITHIKTSFILEYEFDGSPKRFEGVVVSEVETLPNEVSACWIRTSYLLGGSEDITLWADVKYENDMMSNPNLVVQFDFDSFTRYIVPLARIRSQYPFMVEREKSRELTSRERLMPGTLSLDELIERFSISIISLEVLQSTTSHLEGEMGLFVQYSDLAKRRFQRAVSVQQEIIAKRDGQSVSLFSGEELVFYLEKSSYQADFTEEDLDYFSRTINNLADLGYQLMYVECWANVGEDGSFYGREFGLSQQIFTFSGGARPIVVDYCKGRIFTDDTERIEVDLDRL